MTESRLFGRLRLASWRQIRDVEILFHPRLTVITGANGSGKTTILNLVSRHFGWDLPFVSTPEYEPRKGALQYLAGLWRSLTSSPSPEIPKIGEFVYTDGSSCQILVPTTVSQTYQVKFQNLQPVKGIHIPSHRSLSLYQPVDNIPTSPRTRDAVFSQYSSTMRDRLHGSGGRSPHHLIKETLISWATFGYGNDVVQANLEYRNLFDRFERILAMVLPPKLGFKRLSIRIPEVVLETESGHVSLDAVSGGVAAIIDVAWQLFTFASDPDTEFVVTFDEPENHLHPELQQTLLPNLLRTFPRVQFIVATHNPFIVGSSPDSNVYVLDFDPSDRRVTSTWLDLVNKAGTANEILRNVLGVSHTMPLWAAARLDEIVASLGQEPLSDDALKRLRTDLEQIGLGEHVPTALARVVERKNPQ